MKESSFAGMNILFVSFVDHRMNSPKVVHFADWIQRNTEFSVSFLTLHAPEWIETDVHFDTLPFSGSRALRYIHAYRTLVRKIKQYRPAVCIAVYDPACALCAWASKLIGQPFVVLAQEHTHVEGNSLWSRLNAWHHRQASCVLDISEPAMHWRQSCMALRSTQGAFLNVPPLTQSPHKPESASSQIGARNRALRICYAGAISDRACILDFVKAAIESNVYIEFNLYGPCQEPYKNAVEESQRQSTSLTVNFHGRIGREQLWDMYRQHDVGLVFYAKDPKFNYGCHFCCPNKLFEYAAAGLAILASDQQSICEWVSRNDIGISVDPSDTDALSKALLTLVNGDSTKEMGQRAYAMHVREWNMDQQAENAWKLIKQSNNI